MRFKYHYISSMLLAFSLNVSANDSPVIAVLDGEPLHLDLLEQSNESIVELKTEVTNLQSQLFIYRLEAINDLAKQVALDIEAGRRGMTKDQLVYDELRSKLTLPTDEELNCFLSEQGLNEDISESQLFYAKVALMEKQFETRLKDFSEKLLASMKLEVKIELPSKTFKVEQVDSNPLVGNVFAKGARHVRGDRNAPVHAVVYSNFDCGYCVDLAKRFDLLVEENPQQFSYSFRHFTSDETSYMLAAAAECAAKQDEFWSMHDSLLGAYDYDSESLDAIGEQIGLDLEIWNQCREDDEQESFLSEDRKAGDALVLAGTPTAFINGIKVVGAQETSRYKAIINYLTQE